MAYVPLFFSAGGQVSADTKSYLYLDPGRLLSRAPYLWDRNVALGTVTHQTLGYLFPMGPFFWLMDLLKVPDWVAQRIWLGTLIAFAGLGIVYLCRTLRLPFRLALVAAFAYQLSPYVLHYAARISVILMPWAALGWMVAFTVKALHERRWRWPAAFAITVALVGGVNATALLFAGLAAVLWIPYAIWVERSVPARQALGATLRIGLLTLLVSAWWIVALSVQGRYGIPILRYSETYQAVASASSATEVLRSLGYWFFYGADKLYPWVDAGPHYMDWRWLIVVTLLLPALALTGLAAVRFRARGYAMTLVVVGTVLAVGAHPLAHPSPYGRGFLRFVTTTAGLAMRSTPRAVPLVVLGLALGLGAGADALAHRMRMGLGRLSRHDWLAPAAALLVVVLAIPPLWTGGMYSRGILRPENIPSYWRQAAAGIDAGDASTRVLELPGSDFAAYRWGSTVDPITPGLEDRAYVAREQTPAGEPAGVNLLAASDLPMQSTTFEPAALGPIAKLLSAGTVVVRSDLQFERYRTPRPRLLWGQLQQTGLPLAEGYGPALPNTPVAQYPMVDEIELSIPPNAPDPPPVALLDVPGARPIVRTESSAQPLVVAGDGFGLVDMAAAGLLNDDGAPVLYSASLDDAALQSALGDGAHLVVTDTNRRQGLRWSGVRENTGYTEQAGEVPLKADPTDNRLDVFPGTGDAARTVAQQRGVASVQATAYGNPVTYAPEERPAMALDGDTQTAWRVGAFSPVKGERLVVKLTEPMQPGYLTLVQPLTGNRNRYLTKVRLTFDGKQPLDVDLSEASRTAAGQRVDLGERRFSTLQIELVDDNIGKQPTYDGLSGVGFAEVGIPGVNVDEFIRLPVDLLTRAGPAAASKQPLSLVMTRLRTSQREVTRSDPETHLARTFDLPQPRTFTVGGQARFNGTSPDQVIDALLGQPDAFAAGVTATSTGRLLGEPKARASSAIDGDPTTAWTTPIDAVIGQSATFTASKPFTVQQLNLQVVADGRHSVPTRLTLTMNGRETATVEVPPVVDGTDRQHTVTVPVQLPTPLTGTSLAVRIDSVREVRLNEYLSSRPALMPVAIAELGIPGLQVAAPKAKVDTGCRDDLLTVDGTAVPVRVTGDSAAALNRDALTVEGCGTPLTLAAGSHDVRSAIGRDGGLDLDRLVLDSAAAAPAAARPAAPQAKVISEGRTGYTVRVAPSADPVWLVLGQSLNEGWHAVADGRDLGKPQLIDGYANGWRLDTGPSPIDVKIYWAPQRSVWLGLAISFAGLVLCLVLALWPRTAEDDEVVPSPYAGRPVVPSPVLVPVSARDRRLWIAGPALATLVVAWLLAGVVPGILAAAVLAVRLARPAWRRILIAAPAACLTIVAGYVVAKTVRFPIPPSLGWPAAFDAVHPFAFAAVTTAAALVVADILVDRLRWRDVGGRVVRDAPPREVAHVG